MTSIEADAGAIDVDCAGGIYGQEEGLSSVVEQGDRIPGRRDLPETLDQSR